MNHIQSPDTSDAGIERLIQAKGKTAARILPADLEAVIADTFFFTGYQGATAGFEAVGATGRFSSEDHRTSLGLLTFCVLVLRNGFTVTGESACASPENFDAEIGRKIARANAVNKLWPLLGYELKSKLHANEPDFLAGKAACDLSGEGTCEACQ